MPLRLAAARALPLVIASVPLFVLAALIESFVRESAIGSGARFGFAAAAFTLIVGYGVSVVLLARRTRSEEYAFLDAYSIPASRIAR